MNHRLSVLVSVACLAGGALAPGMAAAQSTWNLVSGSGCSQAAANSGNYGNQWNCTGVGNAGTTATASAWSNDRGTGTPAQAGSGFANAYMSAQGTSGFGAASRTELIGVGTPNHSVDSIAPGTFDFIMVEFTTAAILDQFRIGWGALDSDITLMQWAGGGAPTGGTGAVSSGQGSNATLNSTIGATGWQLVSSYSNVCKNSSGVDVSNGNCNAANSTVTTGATTASSYWLIAAYNTSMDPTQTPTWTTGNDGFKLNWLKTVNGAPPPPPPPPGVPEPGSLALAGLALIGVFANRRKVKALF